MTGSRSKYRFSHGIGEILKYFFAKNDKCVNFPPPG